jgi:osomolarity two-component system sensor histidine kinase SLN1
VKLDPSETKTTRRVSLEPLERAGLGIDERNMTDTEKRLSHSRLSKDERSTSVPVSPTNLNVTPTRESRPTLPPVADHHEKTVDDKPVGLRVLVADDNATNLEVLRRMLLLEKVVDVQLAMVSSLLCPKLADLANHIQNGKEAFEKAKADMELGRRFDIIFMDIQVRSPIVPSLGYLHPIDHSLT